MNVKIEKISTYERENKSAHLLELGNYRKFKWKYILYTERAVRKPKRSNI